MPSTLRALVPALLVLVLAAGLQNDAPAAPGPDSAAVDWKLVDQLTGFGGIRIEDDIAVVETVTNFTVQGTANHVVAGVMRWTNSLTGDAGTLRRPRARRR